MILRIVNKKRIVHEMPVVSVSCGETLKGEHVLEYLPDCENATFKQIPFCFLLYWKVFK